MESGTLHVARNGECHSPFDLSSCTLRTMRIGGLSRETGVPVATLKYYLREGLLHPGVATAVNQAEYDDTHVRRVRLVRTLIELGRLSIADVAAVVAAVDDDDVPIHDTFGITQDALVRDLHRDAHADTPELDAAHRLVDDLVLRHGLRVRPDAAVRDMLADAIVHLADMAVVDLHDLGSQLTTECTVMLDSLVAWFRDMAEFEIASVPDTDRAVMVEYTVVGTVVMETVMAAIRRLALEDASDRRFARAAAGRPARSRPATRR